VGSALGSRQTLCSRTPPGREETIAWWAALLFLVHPLRTEAVTTWPPASC
jgi:hypothetical protein